MVNKFLHIFLFSILLSFVVPPPIFAALNASPVTKAPVNQRDKFKTDLFSGSASYEYPIAVPKGTKDLTPEVALSYNSSGSRDFNQRSGAGWQLSQDYIERDVNFTPTNTGDDKFKLHFQGATHDLVYISSDNKYHTKTESFLRIEKIASGGQNTNGEYWIITEKNGKKHRFGYGNNSELICDGRTYVLRWNVDEVTDIHNNYIYHTYTESNGVSYLSKIEYNTDKKRIIDFNYVTNPYQRQIYQQGCSVKEVSRLNTIQVKINTTLVRQYDLNYSQAINNQQLLQSIIAKGSDGSSLPATTLTYNSEVQAWNSQYFIGANTIDAAVNSNEVTLTDMNSDGMADIVRSVNLGGPNNEWRVFKANGTGWSNQYIVYANPIDASLQSGEVRVIDVDGNGSADVVRSVNLGGPNNQWRVFKNNGSSLTLQYEIWANPIDAAVNSNEVTLADANGDSLPDVIRSVNLGGPNNEWRVFLNTGSNWSSQYQVWANPIDASLQSGEVRVIDVNGDSNADIVRSVNLGGPNNEWRVFLSNGSSWASQYVIWANPIDAAINSPETTFADANGDGLTDIIRAVNLGGPNNEWRVFKNLGSGWSGQYQVWAPSIDSNLAGGEVTLAEVNGDGLIDIIRSVNLGGPNNVWRVFKNNGAATNLLSTIIDSLGGTVQFDYKSSTIYDNTGLDDIPDLPFAIWVVDKMTVNNGMSTSHATNDITIYTYQDGFYKWQEKEFRGFGTVNTVEPNTSKKKYVFNQDDALKGLLAEVQHRDASNNPYAEIENIWSNTTTNGVTTVKLDSEKEYSYDGSASNPKIIQTDYLYDSYGNITKKSEKGDTSTTTDDRFIYNEYTYNTSSWILNTPKHIYKHAANDSTKVSESWFYYDGNTGLNDAPIKGDLTKEVQWIDTLGSSNPTTTYTYDSYGNQTSITDASNHITTTAFGTNDTTRTFPDSTTNAKNQTTTTTYDLGTGNLLSKTDPNGYITTYVYDVFGRILKEIQPYDTSSFPTVSYQYFFDGTAPEGTLISKRESSGSAGTLDATTYIDGLGRKIQARSDAEDSSKQITVDTFYDANGNVGKETVPYVATASSTYVAPVSGTKFTEFTFDPLERVTIAKNSKGDSKTIAYDHWKETTIDENGHIKRQFKNAYNKVVKVEEVNGTSTYATNYFYDARDLLNKITDSANNDTTFSYDSLGRKISQTDSDMGTWRYEYDGMGNITKQIDNRNVAITKTYDVIDRLTKTDYPTNTDITYTYDTNGKIGTLSTATDSAGTVNYLYDNRLRKIQEQRTVGGATKTTQFNYDATNRIVTQTNPDGEIITSAYNSQGEVNSVSGVVSNIDYNAFNKIIKKDFVNAVTTNYTYNTSDFRLNRIQTGSLQDYQYSYDNVGNVNSIFDAKLNKTQQFGYDDLDRLKVASESAGGYNYAYSYNSIGNLTKFTNFGADTDYTYGQNAGIHALTSATSSSTVKTVTLTDNWSSGSITSDKWNNWGAPQTSVVAGQVRISSTLSSGYYGVGSNPTLLRDLTGSSVSNQLLNAGNQGLSSWGVYPIMIEKTGANSTLYWAVEGNKVRAYKNVNGVNTMLQEVTYNSTIHKYFKLREAGGRVYWDYSADGTNWTAFTNSAVPFDITAVTIGMNVGTWQSEGLTTAALFDNFNVQIIVPSISTLSEDWSSGAINSSKWDNWGNPQTSIVSNQFRIGSTLSSGYYGIDSDPSGDFDLTGSFVSNQVVNAGNQALTSWGVYPVRINKSGSSNNTLYWAIENNKIKAYKNVNGTSTMLQEITYNSATHKYFKIRENSSTIYWEYSTDGSSWTAFTNTSLPFDVSRIVVEVNVGTWQSESTTTSATFDNLNIWSPQTTALTDDWGTGFIDPTKWSNWGQSQINVTNQELTMSSTTGSGYYGFDSNVGGKRYNLTNAYVINKLVSAGNQSITSWEVYPIYLSSALDSSMGYYWFISGNTLKAYKKVSNVSTQLASTSYNVANHKWFRIREAGGTTYFDTSVDGSTWINFTSTTNAFTLTSMTIGSLIGTWQNEVSTTTAKFDNFNVLMPVYSYDANGNITSDGEKCSTYNEANQLDKVKDCSNNQTIAEYVYDVDGNRMVKKVYSNGILANTVTSWSDSYETKVISGGATENTAYYWVNGELLAKKNPDGSKYYFHNDHLSSASLLTNSSGTIVEETKYDPWGEVKSGGTKSKFLYTGQEKDAETNLNYYNARYYDAEIRRFTQPDDIIQDPYNPQSLNRYSYVQNNPIKNTDPSGHIVDTILDVAFIAYDIQQIAQHGATTQHVAALAADIAGAVIPGVTGGGALVHAAANGGDISLGIAAGTKAIGVTKKTEKVLNKVPQIKEGSAGGKGAGKNFSLKTRAEIMNSSEGCVYCGAINGKMEADHRISKKNNGNNTLENGVKACQHCNRSKGAGDYPKSPPKNHKQTWPPPWWPK